MNRRSVAERIILFPIVFTSYSVSFTHTMRTLDERLPLLAVNSSHIFLILPLQADVKVEISMGPMSSAVTRSVSPRAALLVLSLGV